MKNKHIDLATFAGGALQERMNIDVNKVLENVMDPNTDSGKARSVTLKITFKPNEARNVANVTVTSKISVSPAKDLSSSIMIDYDDNGEIVGRELVSGIKGQSFISEDGEILTDIGEKIEDPRSKKVVQFK
jgi:uncharacterized protein YuzE